jgi:hypothetical protein
MSKRLAPEPWTAEDIAIAFWRLELRASATYMRADRRDAELMFEAQQLREWQETSDDTLMFGGVLPPWLLSFEWACGPVGGDISNLCAHCAHRSL